MSLFGLLILPALVAQAPSPDAANPPLVEAKSGVFILRGSPGPGTFATLKAMKFGTVIDLRRDGEGGGSAELEQSQLAALGITYIRYTVAPAIPPADLDFLRQLIRDSAKGSRVLVHCDDGNRASAAVCAWLVLDKGMNREEALKRAHEGGLRMPATEAALGRYLEGKGKA